MVTVYRLIFSTDFQQLSLKDPAKFHATYPQPFCGLPMQAEWGDSFADPVELAVDDRIKPAADFTRLMDAGFVVRFRPTGGDDLLNEVISCGEPIGARIDDEQCVAVSVHVTNALDPERSEVVRNAAGEIISIRRYEFIPRRLDQNVFKLPETAGLEMFTYTTGRYTEAMEQAVELVPGYVHYELTGLRFEPVWSSE
ncbi:MAG TPA: hypothetical protein PKE27_07530 [Povalibacter sp.]|uniref:hypothetical protein n=1 Tax=Povalibacter sp. TaxID=1962978 RepID=UPI002C37FB43|nr:hypothetical protein [Povalibacter sp.]HMN44405.1 hypothetical protein [Povalibacter sp.]